MDLGLVSTWQCSTRNHDDAAEADAPGDGRRAGAAPPPAYSWSLCPPAVRSRASCTQQDYKRKS